MHEFARVRLPSPLQILEVLTEMEEVKAAFLDVPEPPSDEDDEDDDPAAGLYGRASFRSFGGRSRASLHPGGGRRVAFSESVMVRNLTPSASPPVRRSSGFNR